MVVPALLLLASLPNHAVASLGSGPKASQPRRISQASGAKTVEDVCKLFSSYLKKPGVLKVTVTIHVGPKDAFPDGTGVLVVARGPQTLTSQTWDVKRGQLDFHFVCDGKAALEWSQSAEKYDRHLVRDGLPYGRISGEDVLGYPYALAVGDLRGTFGPHAVLKETTPTYYLLTEHDKGMGGERFLEAKVALNGMLMEMKDDERSPKGQKIINQVFSKYTFSNEKVIFNTKPRVGLTTLQFPETIDVLPTRTPLPSIDLTGHSKTTLAKLAAQGLMLTVFTESQLPKSLESALKSLSSLVSAVVISSEKISANFPVYFTSQSGLDQAGIAATPQFYLTKNGKVLQAWMGWDGTKMEDFIAQVKAASKGQL